MPANVSEVVHWAGLSTKYKVSAAGRDAAVVEETLPGRVIGLIGACRLFK
jgi:hypothetical protein